MALIANYYENILSFLEAHHDGEEDLVFPLLRERCDGAGELIDHMAEQHHEALALLEQAKAALAAWPSGDAAAQEASQERLDELCTHLLEHLERGGAEGAAAGGRAPLHGGVGRHCRATAWPTSTATRSG